MWVTEHRTGNGTFKTYSEELPRNISSSWDNYILRKQPVSSFSDAINDNRKFIRRTDRFKK